MLSFIIANLGTIFVLAILVLVLAAIIVYFIKNKKLGKSSCGCNCANCAMHNSCKDNSNKSV